MSAAVKAWRSGGKSPGDEFLNNPNCCSHLPDGCPFVVGGLLSVD
jgi:hypothetical protein